MTDEGPVLEKLTRHLTLCPADFLAEPKMGTRGAVHTGAVVSDLLVDLGGEALPMEEAAVFERDDKAKRNLLRLTLVSSWLLHEEWFTAAGRFARPAAGWLSGSLDGLAALVSADLFVTDPERREELARLCLRALGLRPSGETEAQASDRLNTMSSVERDRVLKATRAAELHAQQVREAMARKAAEEAAAKVTRE
jgi:hypothetical protein